MPVRTITVLSGDNNHTVETGSHGLRTGYRTAMLYLRGDGDRVMAAATHDPKRKIIRQQLSHRCIIIWCTVFLVHCLEIALQSP